MLLVVLMCFNMMCVPWADGGSDDGRVLVCGHRVFYIGWNVQKAAHRIGLEMLQVVTLTKADLQHALDDCHPRIT